MIKKLILVGATSIALVSAPGVVMSSADAATARTFANCTQLHKTYPHGVGKVGARDKVTSGKPVTNFKRNTAVYKKNTKSDRDKDGVACEKR